MAGIKSKSQPTWSDVKAKLAHFDRPGLLGLVHDLYAASRENRMFLHTRFDPGKVGNDGLEPYKKTIDRWLWPDMLRNQDASAVKAKQAIASYRKAAGQPAELAELMVFYCERAVGFCGDVGYQDEGYLNALVRMFEQALTVIDQLSASQRSSLVARLDRARAAPEAPAGASSVDVPSGNRLEWLMTFQFPALTPETPQSVPRGLAHRCAGISGPPQETPGRPAGAGRAAFRKPPVLQRHGGLDRLISSCTRQFRSLSSVVPVRISRLVRYRILMQTRQLGNSDLTITPLGVGAWAMGGAGWAFSWGPQDDAESVGAIHAALDRGINWIDTAAVYGLGHSEEVVGKAVKERSDRPYVFTKCERTWDEDRQIRKSLKLDSIFRECENSLRRLGVDAIDLYQIHWPEPDEDVEEGWAALADLKTQGKVRWIGVSNFSASQLARAQAIAPVTSLQPPYSMIQADIETDILPFCAANNIGTIVYSPMKSGMLTGAMTRERVETMHPDDFRKRTPNFQEPLLTRNLNLVELLREIGKRHGRTPGEVAIAWTLRRPEVTAAIVGMRSPAQVDGVIGAAEFRLAEAEVAEIGAFLAATSG